MIINNIRANNFRNYEALDLSFDNNKNLNIIHAPNGMGKSNLLEMIYYLSYLRSFRNAPDKDVVMKGKDFFYLECSFDEKGVSKEIKINFKDKKEISLNGKKVNKFSDLLGKLISVLFSSEDIFIINGAPSIRRRFFDLFFSVLDKEYLHHLKKYLSILKQKNFILKQKNDNGLLSVYNMQMSESIVYINKTRAGFIDDINKLFQSTFNSLGQYNEKVKIIYSSAIKEKEHEEKKVYNLLNAMAKKEMEYGFSLTGPHKDNYLFLINGISFSKYASFGQTRLAALVLMIVQTEFFRNAFNTIPVLLLDDVILELDGEKQRRFIDKISEYQQIFITLTNIDYGKLFKRNEFIKDIEVVNGQIR